MTDTTAELTIAGNRGERADVPCDGGPNGGRTFAMFRNYDGTLPTEIPYPEAEDLGPFTGGRYYLDEDRPLYRWKEGTT
jgi:hypothetical protein